MLDVKICWHILQICDEALLILSDLTEHDVVTVSDAEMIMATKLVAERMKLVIEYAAGASVAAVLYHPHQITKLLMSKENCKIGIILCGGNVDCGNEDVSLVINHSSMKET